MSSDGFSRRLARWGVSSSIADRLSRDHSSLLDVLSLTPVELVSITNRNPTHDKRVVDIIAAKRAPHFKSVSQLAEERRALPPTWTSLKVLDEALGGGLPRSSITEFVGPPGVGKTQFCLTLAAVVAAGGLGRDGGGGGGHGSTAKVAYIDTEGAFVSTRLFQIAQNKFPQKCRDETSDRREGGADTSGEEWMKELGENVMVYYAPTCERLMAVLKALDIDVVTYDFQLIVLDSIASTVRKEFHGGQTESLVERAKLLAKEAKMLKEIAQHHEIPIVVTNQITTHFERGGKRQEMDENDVRKDEPGKEEEDDSEEEETHGEEPRGVVTAALGNSWSHFVNTRIALDFDTDDQERRITVGHGRDATTSSRRMLKLLKSPFAPQLKMVFDLRAEGPVISSRPEPLNERGRWRLATKSTTVTTYC